MKLLFLPLKQDSEMCSFGRGLIKDLRRRWPHYLSDFKDGELKKDYPLFYCCSLRLIVSFKTPDF